MSPILRSPLGPQIASYLSLKRALGYRFGLGTDALVHLDRFLSERPRLSTLSPDAFAAWTRTIEHLTPTVRRNRMLVVRRFCLYLRRSDPACFVPDASNFPAPHQPVRPHIFTEDQIGRLLRVATEAPSRSTAPLRAEVYRIAIVLLYTAGLRRGEVVRLVMSDYDEAERTLLVRASKFRKSRLVALSPSAVDEMRRYLRARRRLPHGADSPLLVRNHGGLGAYAGENFGAALRHLFRAAGIHTSQGHVPRVHDLRHTYAVHALLRWYRAGVDVQAKLPVLATAMGHVSVASTAYYLQLIDPIVEAASARFARHCRGILASTRGAR